VHVQRTDEPAFGVDHVDACGVVHCVAAAFQRHLLHMSGERSDHGIGLRLRPTHGKEASIERSHVALKQFLCIALRIDRDEEHVQPIRILVQLPCKISQLEQCRWADIRTMSESEEGEIGLARKALIAHGLAVMRCQRERPADGGRTAGNDIRGDARRIGSEHRETDDNAADCGCRGPCGDADKQ